MADWQLVKLGPGDGKQVQILTNHFHESATNAEWLERWLANPYHHIWAAYAQELEEPIGFLSAYIIDRIEYGRPEFFLYEIEVDDRYYRQGVGRALVEAALEFAREYNMINMFVLTNHDNPRAVAFYRSTGARSFNEDEIMFEYTLNDPETSGAA